MWWQKAGRRGISNRAAIKSSEIGSFVETYVDLETVILSEVSQREKEKYHGVTHMWSLKK